MFENIFNCQTAALIVISLSQCISDARAQQSTLPREDWPDEDVSSLINGMMRQMERMNIEMENIRSEVREYKEDLLLNQTKVLQQALNNITIMQEELKQCKDYKIKSDRISPSNWILNSVIRKPRHHTDTDIIPLQESEGIASLVRLFVPRSCHEWLSIGFTTSGYYLIDPDGREVGEKPVTAFCDMVTGYTFIGHNMEGTREVEECYEPGCYTVDIQYNISMTQVEALIYNSQSCHQSIRVECKNSPLNRGNMAFTWWEDRNGEEHMYWSGSQYGQHMCRCGFSGTCVIPDLNCNCDAAIDNVWLHDEGTLSNITSLPVTKIKFGIDSNFDNSQMRYRLGPLRCYGSNRYTYPTSCKELFWSGVHKPGYYFLGTPDNITLSHCNMQTRQEQEERSAHQGDLQFLSMVQELRSQNPPMTQEINDIIHRLDNLESSLNKQQAENTHSPVILHVHATKDVEEVGKVKFDEVRVDTHRAYTPDSGDFEAPEDGTYFISFYSERQDSSSNNIVRLKKNLVDIAFSRGDKETKYSTFGFSIISKLERGDNLHIHLQSGTLYGCSYGCNGFSIVELA